MLKTADEISISSWVYRGVVDAGALSSVNWNDDKDLPEQFRTEFTVLDESMPFPRSILLIRPGMSEQLTSALKMLLINAEWEALGQIALKAYQRTRRFDELNDSVQMAQQLADMLRDILQTGLSDSGQSAP
jgi:phosphonate transport system substrate-binding protein